jgi:hypothetical protein
MKKLILPFLLICIFSISSYSQTDLGSTLQNVGQEYAQKYLSPLTTGLGTNLNTGYLGGFDASGFHKIPVWPHLYAGVKFCGVVMQDVDKTFNMSFQTNITYNGTTVPVNWTVNNAPTVFGDKNPAIARGTFSYGGYTHDTTLTLIGGIDNTKFVPLFLPQIGVGTVLGTDVIFRMLPPVGYGNYGTYTLYGFALRHSIGAYVEMPFNIAIQGGYQNFSIKDKNDIKFISANSLFANLQFSKSIAIITIYGGVQYENYSVDVNYKFGNVNIGFNQKGDNNFRGIAGATLSLALAKVNLDINYGSKFAFSAGFGFGL